MIPYNHRIIEFVVKHKDCYPSLVVVERQAVAIYEPECSPLMLAHESGEVEFNGGAVLTQKLSRNGYYFVNLRLFIGCLERVNRGAAFNEKIHVGLQHAIGNALQEKPDHLSIFEMRVLLEGAFDNAYGREDSSNRYAFVSEVSDE